MKVYNSAPANNNVVSSNKRNSVDKDGFLKILSAQLQNQDPMNAGDNTQYVAQMAQFAALEQMQNLNQSMSNLLLSQKVIEGNMMIGREVTVDLGDNKTLTGIVTSAKAAKGSVNIVIDGKEYNVDNVLEVVKLEEIPAESSSETNGQDTADSALSGEEVPVEPITGGSEEDVVQNN